VWDPAQERIARWFARQEVGNQSDAALSTWCSRCGKATEHKYIQNPDGKMCKDCGERIYDTEIGRIRVWSADVSWYR